MPAVELEDYDNFSQGVCQKGPSVWKLRMERQLTTYPIVHKRG